MSPRAPKFHRHVRACAYTRTACRHRRTGQIVEITSGPDGHRIVSGSGDNTLRVWPGPAAWPARLCDKPTANMSHQQWRDWVAPDIGYIDACPGLPVPADIPG